MSFFSDFKKNINKAGHSIVQRASGNEKTLDQDFEEELERFKNLEKQSEKAAKEAKCYLDSIRAVTNTQLRIAQTMEKFHDTESSMGLVETEYKQVIERLDQGARTDLDEAYRTTVIEPLVRFCSYFTEVNEAIKHRQKIVADYDTSRAKLKKLMDRPSEDPQRQSRAEQEANMAKEAYENLNTMLLNDLPQLIDLRIAYLDPSFEACIKSQLKFSQDSYGGFEKLKEYFPSHQEAVDHRVDQVIQQMRELTICGNL